MSHCDFSPEPCQLSITTGHASHNRQPLSDSPRAVRSFLPALPHAGALCYRLSALLLLLLALLPLRAQEVTGNVIDAETGEPLAFVNVFYKGGSGTLTDMEGRYRIRYQKDGELHFSLVGYEKTFIQVKQAGVQAPMRLRMSERMLGEAVVKGRKKKYSRRNNPAVEMMKKVIAAKKQSDLTRHDYYSFDIYRKRTLAFNEVSESIFDSAKYKKVPFLKEHVEMCPETGKLILPLSVEESVTREIYRKSPKETKQIILGERATGINDFFNTGDILTVMLNECFTDVNIYEDEIRLFQFPFTSPIATRGAISFYRYFIEDTVYVDGDKCFQLSFTPNNPQDFGFSGMLFVLADSSYRVKRADIGIPHSSDVNFVDNMQVIQTFSQLPSGEQILTGDDMIVQLKVTNFLQKFMVRRNTQYRNFDFSPIDDKAFRFKGKVMTDANAMMRDRAFWEEHRPDTLSKSEDQMGRLMTQLQNVKGFKAVLFVAKAFIENFVETSVDPENPSKVDIGPVNTMISQNHVDGLRLRASAQTTANFHPNLFLKGYGAYGFKDHRWKGMGEVTYSFNKKAYLPREFPVNNLTFTYTNDVMAPSDKFMPTDKDNVFTSFKWTSVDHMNYYENLRLLYDREWANGLRVQMQLRTERTEPTASLFYQALDGTGAPSADPARHIRRITTTDASFTLRYQPGTTWINTKQRRIETNHDSPVLTLSHTVGLKGVLGGDYTYNLTEAGIYKRFWLGSWGKIDTYLKGGVQWNQVPFPLLIMPAANLSYIIEDNTFNLIDNMEFLNDRYASLMISWDMNGKLFNRIPLLRRLKWREFIGCNVLWGSLSSKNNPFLAENADNGRLFYFPGQFDSEGRYHYTSGVMDENKPYVELIAGVHNIFKIFHIEYVRRLNYLDNPSTHKWGIRFMFRLTF